MSVFTLCPGGYHHWYLWFYFQSFFKHPTRNQFSKTDDISSFQKKKGKKEEEKESLPTDFFFNVTPIKHLFFRPYWSHLSLWVSWPLNQWLKFKLKYWFQLNTCLLSQLILPIAGETERECIHAAIPLRCILLLCKTQGTRMQEYCMDSWMCSTETTGKDW